MGLAKAFLSHIVATVLTNHRADLKVIGRDIAKLEAVIAPSTAAPSQNSVILGEGAAGVEGPAVPTAAPSQNSVILSEGAAGVEGPAVPAAAPSQNSVILSEGAAGVEGPAVPTAAPTPNSV